MEAEAEQRSRAEAAEATAHRLSQRKAQLRAKRKPNVVHRHGGMQTGMVGLEDANDTVDAIHAETAEVGIVQAGGIEVSFAEVGVADNFSSVDRIAEGLESTDAAAFESDSRGGLLASAASGLATPDRLLEQAVAAESHVDASLVCDLPPARTLPPAPSVE